LIDFYFAFRKIVAVVADLKPDPRWERTRRALIDGGRRAMAKKGVEASTVLEIVKEAGVSQPSFYNHFASKDDLAQAIAADFFQSDAVFKSRVFEAVADPAEAIAINARHTLRVATQDPVVAWVVVRSGPGRNLLRIGNADLLVRMINTGIQSGRFRTLNPRVAAAVIRGAAFPLLQNILQGTAPVTVEAEFAEMVLCMLGIEPAEAGRIARLPDPKINDVSVES
jgi:AcrR family transcriptional regulator